MKVTAGKIGGYFADPVTVGTISRVTKVYFEKLDIVVLIELEEVRDESHNSSR